MTEIKANINYANGVPVNGRVVVWWSAFLINGGVNIAGGMLETEIVGGVLDVSLEANAGTQPLNNYYTVQYELENGPVYDEYWIVPAISQASLAQVQVNFPVEPSVMINPLQLTSLGASAGMFLQWNGTSWIPQYISITAVDPNYINLAVTGNPAADATVVGSPVMLGHTVTINIPDAGANARGLITPGTQNIGGEKHFLNKLYIEDRLHFEPILDPSTGSFGDVYLTNFTPVVFNQMGIACGLISNAVPQIGFPRDPEIPSSQASVLFPSTNANDTEGWAGVGLDSGGNIWLRTALFTDLGQFFYLQPDGSTMCRLARFDAFQHPTVPGATPLVNDASLVLYNTLNGPWVGLGVDSTPALWLYIGQFGGPQALYHFDANQATFTNLTVTGTLTAPGIGGYVPESRRINTGIGLAGGGNLSADLTLSVVADTTIQRLQFAQSGGLIGPGRPQLNFIAGPNMTVAMSDDSGANRMDVTLASSGGMADPTTTQGDLITRNAFNLVRLPRGLDGQVLSTNSATTTALEWINVLADPTTSFGDLIASNGVALERFPLGANGLVLQADRTQPLGLLWAAVSGGGGQTPWLSDIDAANFSLNDLRGLGIGTNVGATPVGIRMQLFSGEFQAIYIAQPSAADSIVCSLVNSLLDSFEWRLYGSGSGVNPRNAALYSTNALVFENAAGEAMRLTAAGRLGVGVPAPAYPLDVAGDINTSGVFRINGVVLTNSVTSVFGRTGVITAQPGDYTAAQVTNAVSTTGSYANPAWITSLAYSKITGAPVVPVSSVFGRTGVVIAQPGDYTAAQVTNAVDTTGAYANPAWITSLAYSKITGAPAAIGQTPWLSDIDAANFNLSNAGAIGIGAASGPRGLTLQSAAASNFDISALNSNSAAALGMVLSNNVSDQVQFGLGGSALSATNLQRVAFLISTRDLLFGTGTSLLERMRITAAGLVGIGKAPAYALDVAGDCNITGVYRVNGVPISTGGAAQTPWTSDINAASFKLNSAGAIGIGVAASPQVLLHLNRDPSGANSPGSAILLDRAGSNVYGGGIWATYSGTGLDMLQLGVGTNLAPTSNPVLTIVATGSATAGGNVGIGTTSPRSLLTVLPATNPAGISQNQIAICESGNNAGYQLNLGFSVLNSQWNGVIDSLAGGAGTPLLINPSGGNIAIHSTAAPAYALDVTGDVNCTGNFRKNGVIISGGGVTTQNVVTGSRALGGIYQNTTGKAMWVNVQIGFTAGNNVFAYSDSSASPATVVASVYSTTGQQTLAFVVLPSNYYRILNAANTSLVAWIEWY